MSNRIASSPDSGAVSVDAHGRTILHGNNHRNGTFSSLGTLSLCIEVTYGSEHTCTFCRDPHHDIRADYILAKPPFNDSNCLRKDDNVRWQFGIPTYGNPNFSWRQHFIHHLALPGMPGFVLADATKNSNKSGEDDTRRAIIEADLVDSKVAFPGQFLHSMKIPVRLWFLRDHGKAGTATFA